MSAFNDEPTQFGRQTNSSTDLVAASTLATFRASFGAVDSSPEESNGGGRYVVLEEVGRGGMGCVLKVHDRDLGRDLAVKVLQESLADDSNALTRFVEEAQIGGQLQHPGIVPVYELGRCADHRPYFTMKLVEGRTLAAMLKDRSTPQHDLPRFLGIFEQICQTLAYAHSRGVIHRDLKPANVMVGAFGEVQVMDWGLAKVLGSESRSPQSTPTERVRTVRSFSSLQSAAGEALGTPAYMPPEQARGELEQLTERSDVFGLGAILCEILTGSPPFVSPNRLAAFQQSGEGELGPAFSRLERCGADAELVRIANKCLDPAPEHRLPNAGALSTEISSWRLAVQDRLRQAELAGAEARATTIEERKRRKVQLALAASVAAIILLSGGGWAWIKYENIQRHHAGLLKQAQRAQEVDSVLVRANLLRERAQQEGDAAKSAESRELAKRAEALLEGESAHPELAVRVEALRRALEADEEDRRLLTRVETVRLLSGELQLAPSKPAADQSRYKRAVREYRRLFGEYRHDPDVTSPDQTSAWVRDRPPSSRNRLVSALDDWLSIARVLPEESKSASWLLQVLVKADDDPWRARLRDAGAEGNVSALEKLAADPVALQQPVPTLELLGTALWTNGARASATNWLRRAHFKHPEDFWLNYQLGTALHYSGLQGQDEAGSHFTAALALRPQSPAVWLNIGAIRTAQRRPAEAEMAFNKALELNPEFAVAYLNRGLALVSTGQAKLAIPLLEQALHFDPDLVEAQAALSVARAADKSSVEVAEMAARGDFAATITAFRTLLLFQPNSPEAHAGLGMSLAVNADFEAAVPELKKAVELKPDFQGAHYVLAESLRLLGHFDEAVKHYQTAVTLKPDHAEAWCYLGWALQSQGKFVEALKAFKTGHEVGSKTTGWDKPSAQWIVLAEKSMELDSRLPAILKGDVQPADAVEQASFADLCRLRGKPAVAVRMYSEAFVRDPKLADVHRYNAACSATLAAAGVGDDVMAVSDAERVRFRQQALDWLRAELEAWTKRLSTASPAQRLQAIRTLKNYLGDPDLASVRDAESLNKLSSSEQETWRKLWIDHATLTGVKSKRP